MERANEWAKLLDLHNSVHFMMANATVSLESMLATYPGPLSLVTVQVVDLCISLPVFTTQSYQSAKCPPAILSFPIAEVKCLTIALQFPDPHFKARHKKRRVVQPQLVRAIARIMPRGGAQPVLSS